MKKGRTKDNNVKSTWITRHDWRWVLKNVWNKKKIRKKSLAFFSTFMLLLYLVFFFFCFITYTTITTRGLSQCIYWNIFTCNKQQFSTHTAWNSKHLFSQRKERENCSHIFGSFIFLSYLSVLFYSILFYVGIYT